MDSPGILPPALERSLGLGFYATATPGAGGGLKERAEDFRVDEISAYPIPDENGPFTVLRIASRQWEQHELAQRIAQRLGLPPHSIDWAGTKDRRAVAERLFSYRGAPPDRLDIPGVELREAYRARSGLVLGHHYGNRFDIRLSNDGVDGSGVLERWRSTLAALAGVGELPNFFGLQRFGEVRPVTHEVGRWIVRGRPDRAVEVYLTDLASDPTGPGAEARRSYATHRDPRRALTEFPASYRFERILLDHLSRGQPPARALRGLPHELRMLFIHAYQSLLFNRLLSARRAAGIDLNRPVPGDHVLRVARDGTIPGVAAVPVADDNLPECEELVRTGRGRVAGPLVGFGTSPPEGPSGALVQRILDEEGVSATDFRSTALPELASRGSYRPMTIPLPVIGLTEDRSDGRPDGARFRFALPKGSYATVLLREFLKTGATSVAGAQ